MTTTDTARIRALNDALRTSTEPIGALMMNGSLVITASITAKGVPFVERCVAAVRAFDAFTPGDDPYQEHDMAFLDVDGERLFFKVDYYDANLEWLSPDPADAGLTRRVLTIGMAEDY